MSLWRHILPLSFGIAVLAGGGLLVMIFGPETLTDDAIATLMVGAIGVLGTHLGHVTGHALGHAEPRKDSVVDGRVPALPTSQAPAPAAAEPEP